MKRVAVANRGEIAVRVIRACQEAGLETVAVFSEADRSSLHAQMADQAVCIGPPRPSESYLKGDAIVQVALATGCDAVHPGYGFLSENAGFAQEVVDAGLTFIGPRAEVIRAMGDKVLGRAMAVDAGVPVVDGTSGEDVTYADIEALAARSGYPILLKAAAGGGGRGMRIVKDESQLRHEHESAQAEARAAFGDGTIYAERFLRKVRHVEVQIMGDHHGNVVHFGTRDCTIQRRHQKVVEEAPAVFVPEDVRYRISADAVRLAQQLGYVGAGTIEFVVDADTGSHHFIEVNTRIQVEHPVSEMISGHDLIREQLRVCDPANSLSVTQDDIQLRGHAIEVRINAEDPQHGFAPAPGKVTELRLPAGPGVRVDTHCYPGYTVPPYYDSMIAKLVVRDVDRPSALRRARRALGELRIEGLTTNASFLMHALAHPDVVNNAMTTTWLEKTLDALLTTAPTDT